RYPVSGIRYPVSGIRYPVSGIRYPVSPLNALYASIKINQRLMKRASLARGPFTEFDGKFDSNKLGYGIKATSAFHYDWSIGSARCAIKNEDLHSYASNHAGIAP
uniref:hypothetical protein n=1 Tax=Aeromonas allosaccharophila TaxID=656 RepID=UPI0019551720